MNVLVGVRLVRVWVTHNKGDLRTLDIRSRLVVQKTKKVSIIAKNDFAAVFSATPPLEPLRLILSITMSVGSDGGEPVVLRFLDVSRAHPHVPIKRLVYIELPLEANAPLGMCGRLNGLLYGCRDASQGFEFFVCEILVTEGGFMVGRFYSCIYWHAERRIRVWVHGDDFIISATRANSLWVLQLLRRRLVVKDRGVFGTLPTDMKEIRCMQRTI